MYILHALLPITSWGLQGDRLSGVNSIAYLKRHLYIERNQTPSTNQLPILPLPDIV